MKLDLYGVVKVHVHIMLRKVIMFSSSLDHCERIEKDLGQKRECLETNLGISSKRKRYMSPGIETAWNIMSPKTSKPGVGSPATRTL